jgi:3-hydroxyacyl-CoA dehydrogenase
LVEKFQAIASAKVATSAYEAYGIGVLDKKKDLIVLNSDRLIAAAKERAIELSEAGYVQKAQREDITVLGKAGGYASEHDMKIAKKIAYVMCGGDLSAETKVSEQYLLDLEREAFLSLCGEKKSLERIQSILTSGKPLRN